MEKVSIGTNAKLCPMPVTLIGSIVEGRANFMLVVFASRVNMNPPLIGIGLNKRSATREAVLKNGVFSINFPTPDMVQQTDYCGLVSGKNTDKSKLFDIFYGTLPLAPMIRNCHYSFECKVVETHDFETHTYIIGEIVASYLDKSCLTDGKPDPKKINPFVLTMPDNRYWAIGECIGNAWSIGNELKIE